MTWSTSSARGNALIPSLAYHDLAPVLRRNPDWSCEPHWDCRAVFHVAICPFSYLAVIPPGRLNITHSLAVYKCKRVRISRRMKRLQEGA